MVTRFGADRQARQADYAASLSVPLPDAAYAIKALGPPAAASSTRDCAFRRAGQLPTI